MRRRRALFYGVLGVVLGGRLGYVLFYKPAYYLEHWTEIPAVWSGGMSFHGGFLGVLVAVALFARRADWRFFQLTDFIAPLVPLGLAAGNEYAVKIASVTNALVFDTSDNYFEVVQGTSGTTVAVTAPNGGEIFVLGTSNDITWTSDITGNVRITLLKGGVQVATIAFGTPNDGLYTWTVSPMLAPGTDYTVKVGSCINPLVFDESDAPFEIAESDGVVSKTALKTAVLETNEQLTLSLYPNPASEVLNIVSGSTINHVWVMNSLGQTVFETPLNSTQLQLDVNEMLPDMYFVRIESEGIFTTHKIFVK